MNTGNNKYLILGAIALVFAVIVAAMALFAGSDVPQQDDPVFPVQTSAVNTGNTDTEPTDSDIVTASPETTDDTAGADTDPGGVTDGEFTFTGNYTPSKDLSDALGSALETFGRPVGLCAVDIATGMTISHGADDAFAPASVVKVVYALYCFRCIDAGEASFDEILTYTAEDRVYGNGVIGRMGVGAKLTLYDVLYHTINTSDNEGYYMLLRRFGRKGCDEMTSELGCTTCKFSSSRWPRISARDLALVWAEIYKYRAETDCGSILYDMLLNVEYMHFFRDATGHGTANKAGWNDEACNEGGIVYGDRVYILVILTEGSYHTANMDAFSDMVRAVDAMMSEYNGSAP